MTTFSKNERFTASYQDPEEDRRGGWCVIEWTSCTQNEQGDIIARSGKKVSDCYDEESAVNKATTLNLKWQLQNEQD